MADASIRTVYVVFQKQQVYQVSITTGQPPSVFTMQSNIDIKIYSNDNNNNRKRELKRCQDDFNLCFESH